MGPLCNKFTVYNIFNIGFKFMDRLEMLLLLDTLPVAGAHGVSGLTRGLWYTSKPLWCRRTMASHVRCFQSALGEDGIPWVAKGFPKFEGEVRVDFGSKVSFKRLPSHVFFFGDGV